MEIKIQLEICNELNKEIKLYKEHCQTLQEYETICNKKWISVDSLFEYFTNWVDLTEQDLKDYIEDLKDERKY